MGIATKPLARVATKLAAPIIAKITSKLDGLFQAARFAPKGLLGMGDDLQRMADRRLYDQMKKAFEKNGGEVWDDDWAAQHLFELYGPGTRGASEEVGQIILSPNAARSHVFEEFIHNTQRLKGRYQQWVDEFGEAGARIKAEIEAQQKLLQNADKWGIPENEISNIRQRLQGFLDEWAKFIK
jgi:hypothetical protein